jgi:hypothetical protein
LALETGFRSSKSALLFSAAARRTTRPGIGEREGERRKIAGLGAWWRGGPILPL